VTVVLASPVHIHRLLDLGRARTAFSRLLAEIRAKDARMTAHGVVIGLLLAFPWSLVGLLILGSAQDAARRWLRTVPVRCDRRQSNPRALEVHPRG
jgi:hypothetical protein